MRKKMKAYALKVGECEFKGCRSRDRFKPQVHHIKRVEDFPELAEEESNFICLCKRHHFGVGHPCSYHKAVDNVREICEGTVIIPEEE